MFFGLLNFNEPWFSPLADITLLLLLLNGVLLLKCKQQFSTLFNDVKWTPYVVDYFMWNIWWRHNSCKDYETSEVLNVFQAVIKTNNKKVHFHSFLFPKLYFSNTRTWISFKKKCFCLYLENSFCKFKQKQKPAMIL